MEKQHAVESEDFNLAKSLKFQIDELRLKISQHLQKHNLFDEFGHLTKEETLQSKKVWFQRQLLVVQLNS